MAQHKVVQYKYVELTSLVTTSQVYTGDSQGIHGSKIAEITMTPKNANNKILLDVSIPICGESGDHSYGYASAIYLNGYSTPIQFWLLTREHNDQGGVLGNVNHQDFCSYCCSTDADSALGVSLGLAERTYKLHFGCSGGNANINGAGNTRPTSGATNIQSLFTLTEVQEI